MECFIRRQENNMKGFANYPSNIEYICNELTEIIESFRKQNVCDKLVGGGFEYLLNNYLEILNEKYTLSNLNKNIINEDLYKIRYKY